MKSCFFIGHREAPDTLLPILKETIRRLIEEHHVTVFTVGQYGAFDRIAVQAVKELRCKYPQISLSLLLPYHPFDRPITTPPGFDGTFYPPGMERVPKRVAIVRANRWMVENSDYLVAYAWHPASNALELVRYARGREQRGQIQVLMIAPDEE